MNNKRVIYLEYLRMIAMFSVILLHITSKAISLVEPQAVSWYVYNFLRCFCKWGVNVFIMISGILFLNPQRTFTIKQMWEKYIRHIIVILFTWSLLYAVYPLIRDMVLNRSIVWSERIPIVIRNFVLGNYHLWYLYMLIGLYMITPLLREMIQKPENLRYFLVLSAVITLSGPILSNLEYVSLLKDFVNQFHLSTISGYVFSFVLGYHIGFHEFTKRQINLAVVMFFASLCMTIIITSKNSWGLFLVDGVFSIGVTVMSAAIFILAKYSEIPAKLKKVIEYLSPYTLGIYLVHAFFVHYITIKCMDIFKPGIDVCISFCMVFLISYIIIALIKRIPFLGKIII